jgi:DNA-binding NtrC family response regulator
MELQWLALTKDALIRELLSGADLAGQWRLMVYEEASHLLSAPLERAQFILIDGETAGGSYLQILKRIRKRNPLIDAMVVGGPKSKEVLDRERNDGVDHYFARPIEGKSLVASIRHRLDISRVKAVAGFAGRSQQIQEVIESILMVAPTEVPILIQGESGTGKDVLARTIHLVSKRVDGPFEAINCASLAEGVLESELFGHEKGSFTGAVAQRQGVFERATKGTIFLDEVGEMSANMQVRLLRVLESGEVLRVGGVKTLQVDVRVLAATNRNLSEAVRAGTFRQDLYYRLKGVTFQLPPLRERADDLPLLVDYFILDANKRHGRTIKGMEHEALRRLSSYSWPGNIRELRNLIDTLVVLANTERIRASDVELQLRDAQVVQEPPLLPVAAHKSKAEAEREMIYASILALHRDVREILQHLRDRTDLQNPWDGMREVPSHFPNHQSRVQTLSHMERTAIQEALRASGGNRRMAAEMLGISERTLYRKIREYGLI